MNNHNDADHETIGRCYGCKDRQEFEYVFLKEVTAAQITRGEHQTIVVKQHPYIVADTGQFDQERVAIEVMYRALFEPSTYNNNLIHRGLDNIELHKSGEFRIRSDGDKRRQPLRTMPTVTEIASTLKERLGYFVDEGVHLEQRIKALLEQALPKRL